MIKRNTICIEVILIMHMADALISPVVGGVMWAVAAATVAYSSQKLKMEIDTKKIPLMGVMGAFIFAAQMINFSIPGTGSSGHLGGGMILALLLGPYAGFLAITSVLVIQSLFFADGGLLALGCNIINLGFFPCFIAYPFIYKKLKDDSPHSIRSNAAVFLAVLVGLQLGAFFVVLETYLSGIASLSFGKFILFMQPIHLAIGIVEAVITIAVVNFVFKARPDLIDWTKTNAGKKGGFPAKVIVGTIVVTLIIGGLVSWFASSNPDGLEWAILQTTGKEELENPENFVHTTLNVIQKKTALLPEYDFKTQEVKLAVSSGTSFSGIIGVLITLIIIVGIGFVLNLRKKKNVNE